MNEKQQIVVIHGGGAFASYEEYMEFLKSCTLELKKLKPTKDWKDSLQDVLGDTFEVLQPRMPNSTNAQYEEWKIWFEKVLQLVNDEVILIGHFLGGIFLAKYLSENKAFKTIKAIFLVSAPFDATDMTESLGSFIRSESLKKLKDQVKQVFLYHSKDDKVVPFSHAHLYKQEILEATLRVFEDRGHMKQDTFLELVEDIKGC